MANSMLVCLWLCALVWSACAEETPPTVQSRLFFLGNTSGLTIGLNSLYAALLAALAGLVLLAALAFLIFLLSGQPADTSYSGYSSGYSGRSGGYSARSGAYVRLGQHPSHTQSAPPVPLRSGVPGGEDRRGERSQPHTR